MDSLGRFLIISGAVLIGLGLWLRYGPKLPFLRQLGHLPGDIIIQTPRFSFYFPLVTCLVISGLLTLIFIILRR